MQMIDIECDTRQDAGGVQPIKIMAGNKCDLKEARVISSRQGLEYARGKGCGFMETSAREMVNIEETFARESGIFCRQTPDSTKSQSCHQVLMSYGTRVLLTSAVSLVIVRRVVAARRAHASAMDTSTRHNKNGLFSHGHSAFRTQPLTPIGDKEAADMTDFPERPGAKKTKRGGFWARFKCW